MTLCLTKAELDDLTGCKHRRKQMEALTFMDIEYRVNPAGEVKVLRTELDSVTREERFRGEPNYGPHH